MSIFRAYDIRGVVPEEFNATLARTITRAYIQHLSTNPHSLRIAVARDNRNSSSEIHAAVIETLQALGVQVTDIGLSSTPMFYYAVDHLSLDGGLQITASHNPAQFNGIKLVGAHAAPIGQGSGMEEIEKLTHDLMTEELIPSNTPGAITSYDVMPTYIQANLDLAGTLTNVNALHMVVDTGNGVSALMSEALITKAGLHADKLYFDLDGSFPNRPPDPLAAGNISTLQTQVVAQGADFGIAFDADGDRIVFVDERGQIVPSDILTALLAPQLLTLYPKAKIGADVRSSHIVAEVVSAHGGIPVMTRVGHAFIKSQMRLQNIEFVGELSGHFYFKSIGYYEAPLLVWLAVMHILASSGKKLSELTAPLRKYFQSGEKNFVVSDKSAALKKIEAHFASAKVIVHLDGATIGYDDWWCNIRPSNTENLLRLNLEANSQELLKEKLAEIQALLEK